MREVRYRAWDIESPAMLSWEEIQEDWRTEGYEDAIFRQDHYHVMQWTGLCDKHGVEFCESDLLRIKNKVGDGEMSTNAIFRVFIDLMDGLELRFVALFGDEENNQIPVEQTLCAKYRSLTLDHNHSPMNRIAVNDTWGENSTFVSKWRVNYWSDNIEIIGNIHENGDLI